MDRHVLKLAKCYSELSYPILINLYYQEIIFYTIGKARVLKQATWYVSISFRFP